MLECIAETRLGIGAVPFGQSSICPKAVSFKATGHQPSGGCRPTAERILGIKKSAPQSYVLRTDRANQNSSGLQG
jgi:hypothetical protein